MKLPPMLLGIVAFALAAFVPPARAASDADVWLVKTKKVVIAEDKITIVADARAKITIIYDPQDPKYKGDRWQGMPVSRVNIIGEDVTFTIKRTPHEALASAWKETLQLAKDLQDGKETGRIGFYAPEMTIKENMLHTMTGEAFIYAKGN